MEPISAALLAMSAASGIGNTVMQATQPRRQYKWNKKAMHDQNALNRENAEWALAKQRELQAEAREYDSPQAQMQRYIEAGLNPNLIYGSGASSGGAFPVDFGGVAPARLEAPDASLQLPDLAGSFIRNAQAINSANLTEAKTQESLMKQQSIAIQNEIAKANPMLRPEVAASVADMMERTASKKALENWAWTQIGEGDTKARVWRKVEADLEAAVQRLGLNTKDLAIKNQILQSKEFENVIKEINAKWMQDKEITPEHIRQGLMLILSRMLP